MVPRRRLEAERSVLARVASGAPLDEILAELVTMVERESEEMLCTILVRDGEELVPATGEVADRPPSWTAPIRSPEREEIGTLRVAYREPRARRDDDEEWASVAANLAGIAIAHARTVEALRLAEDRLRFLHELADVARDASDTQALLRASLALLGKKLGVSRCVFGDFSPDEDGIFVAQDYCDGCKSLVGAHQLSSFGPRLTSVIRSGAEPFVADDIATAFPEVEAALFDRLSIRSLVSCTLVRSGRARAFMSIHHHAPRRWKKHEISLVRETGERLWSAIEQRAAEDRLQENVAQLRIAGRLAKVGAWSIDLQAQLLVWSDQLYLIHEMPVGAPLTVETALASCAPEYLETATADMKACMTDGTPFDAEAQIITATGRRVWVRVLGAAERDDAGNIVRIHGAMQDIDDQRRLETQLREAAKMEAVGRLAGGVAHDFNNLLSVILSYSAFLIGGLSIEDPLRNDLEQIHGAGKRASDLTRQLLTFSSQQAVSPRRLDLRQVIGGVEKMLRRLVGREVGLAVVAPETLGPVFADEGLIEQVVMNLVVNARDAVVPGGKITIETSDVALDEAYAAEHHGVTPGPHVMLAVSDDGHGMDEATRARIFEPFFTTKEKGKGTGLGLATVYGIVAQSGGHIWVYSEPGLGTTFKLFFPRTNLPAAVGHVEEAPSPTSQGGSETILVVEDSEPVRTIICAILRRAGYGVIEAPDARAALDACRTHDGPIDLLLTDLVLPRVMGRDLARQAVEACPSLRVLYMSGYGGDAAVQHGLVDAGVAFLAKPITPDGLLAKTREVLDRRGSLPPSRPRKHVLHVDDEETLVVLMSRILERLGYRVSSFTDPREALSAFEAAPNAFHAVVTDIDMPAMNGFEMVRRMRARRADVPVVVTSGAFRSEDIRTAEGLELNALVLKPNTVDELGRVLHEQLKTSVGRTP